MKTGCRISGTVLRFPVKPQSKQHHKNEIEFPRANRGHKTARASSSLPKTSRYAPDEVLSRELEGWAAILMTHAEWNSGCCCETQIHNWRPESQALRITMLQAMLLSRSSMQCTDSQRKTSKVRLLIESERRFNRSDVLLQLVQLQPIRCHPCNRPTKCRTPKRKKTQTKAVIRYCRKFLLKKASTNKAAEWQQRHRCSQNKILNFEHFPLILDIFYAFLGFHEERSHLGGG